MKLTIKVKPNALTTRILADDPLTIAIAAPAVDDKANIALLKFLKKHFHKQARLVSGRKSKDKVVELL